MAIGIPVGIVVDIVPFSIMPSVADLPHVLQRINGWCWAAGIEMVTGGRLVRVDQCEIVNRRFQHEVDGIIVRNYQCCEEPDLSNPNKCAQSIYPFELSHELIRNRIPFDEVNRRLSPDEIIAAMQARKPILAAWLDPNTDSGHLVVIVGFDAHTDIVSYNDPAFATAPRQKLYSQQYWPAIDSSGANYDVYNWITSMQPSGCVPSALSWLASWRTRATKNVGPGPLIPGGDQDWEAKGTLDTNAIRKKIADALKKDLGRLVQEKKLTLHETIPYESQILAGVANAESATRSETPFRLVQLKLDGAPRYSVLIRFGPTADDPFRISGGFPKDVAERLEQTIQWIDTHCPDAAGLRITDIENYATMIVQFKRTGDNSDHAIVAYAPSFITVPEWSNETNLANILDGLSQQSGLRGIVADR